MAIQVGDQIPDSSAFHVRSFPDLSGHWAVVYFFPQGNHPYCVLQSRRFQALLPEFEKLKVQLVGISVDSEEQQKAFKSLCALEFPVVSDSRYEISRAYGVLETQMYEGELVTYARRETFLINPQGQVVHHWADVKPNVHAAEVLTEVRHALGVFGAFG